MKKFLLGVLTGIFLRLLADGLILLAFAERGYSAIGGEWILIIFGGVGLTGCGYKLRDWQARESKRKETASDQETES